MVLVLGQAKSHPMMLNKLVTQSECSHLPIHLVLSLNALPDVIDLLRFCRLCLARLAKDVSRDGWPSAVHAQALFLQPFPSFLVIFTIAVREFLRVFPPALFNTFLAARVSQFGGTLLAGEADTGINKLLIILGIIVLPPLL